VVSALAKNQLVVVGALLAAGVAFAVWYQKYNSPYERCVRAAYLEATATRVLKVTGDGAKFTMEWSTSEMPSDTQIDAALARKRAGEPEPIRYAAPKPSELGALTGCMGLLR